MIPRKPETQVRRRAPSSAILVAAGIVVGLALSAVHAQMAPPSEHKGLTVAGLGVIAEDSLSKIGLTGHKMQLRAITIAPGGQIAKHSHATRPGLVKVIAGTWTVGTPSGEKDVSAQDSEAILEDKDTIHWFFNHTDKPATALVCDIVPSG